MRCSAAAGAAGLCAAALARVSRGCGAASQSARLGVSFVALLVPAVAMYPSLFADATDGQGTPRRRRCTRRRRSSQRDDLQRRLQQAVEQIDAHAVAARNSSPARRSKRRPPIARSSSGRDTDLATLPPDVGRRAVRRRRPAGQPVRASPARVRDRSHRMRPAACSWEQPFDEVSPFGSSERHVLRTSRGICERRPIGRQHRRARDARLPDAAVHLVAEPVPRVAAAEPQAPAEEGVSGRDVEFAVYGWSRAPIFESGTASGRCPTRVFDRLVESREPFWATVERDGQPLPRLLPQRSRRDLRARLSGGHLVGHSDQPGRADGAGGRAVRVLLVGRRTVRRARLRDARPAAVALLREVRSSFYRKLFLTFVAGAVVPVFILAVVIRTYFAQQLLDGRGRSGGADRDDRAAPGRRLRGHRNSAGVGGLDALDDQIMVLVARAIDEDVNLFERTHLQATSARDLFASQLLSTRTPATSIEHPARSAADLRRRRRDRRGARIGWRRRRCGPAAATASSPCR